VNRPAGGHARPRLRRWRAVGPARTGTPWRETEWCAVDLELTGLDPRRHQIVAIGAVPVIGGRVALGESVYTLVRSMQRSEPGAVLTHKLRLADLVHAPPVSDALALLATALDGRIAVFHTAAIERAFLGRAFAGTPWRLGESADTEVLGRLWLRERTGTTPARLSLVRLARELGIPMDAPHHALADALATACAFVSLAGRFDAAHPQTVGTLLRAGDRLHGGRRLG
jgi:DNA polymerase-3 subunit epsilon